MQQVGGTPTLENTEHTGIMGGGGGGVEGLQLCGSRYKTTEEKIPALCGRAGQRPQAAFSATPHAGRRGSASGWRRSPREGLGFPKRRGLSSLDCYGIKPRGVQPPSTTAHPRRARPPRPRTDPSPAPQCLPHFPAFRVDRVPLPASGFGPTRASCPPRPVPRAPRRRKPPAGRRSWRK